MATDAYICLVMQALYLENEIFGIVVDIMVGSFWNCFLAPGQVLGHGFTSLFYKAMSMVWALWLIAGPALVSLMDLFNDVVAVTVDMGVETGVSAAANRLGIFGRSIDVKVPRAVLENALLMPFACHIYDWHHLLSGALKNACYSAPLFSHPVCQIRSITAVLRNDGLRSTFLQHLDSIGRHDYSALCKSFTAKIAKLRFETLCDVTKHLGRVSEPVRLHWRSDIFQGRTRLSSEVTTACQVVSDSFVWAFVIGLSGFCRVVDRFAVGARHAAAMRPDCFKVRMSSAIKKAATSPN